MSSALPYEQHIPLRQTLSVTFKLFRTEDHIPDPAADELFSLINQFYQVLLVNIFPYKYQVDNRIVNAAGKVTGHIGPIYVPQLGHHPFDDLVEANGLQQDVVNVAEQRVPGIGAENLLIALHLGSQ